MAGAVERFAAALDAIRVFTQHHDPASLELFMVGPHAFTLTDAHEILAACCVVEPDCAGLTERQSQALRFINEFRRDHGHPPSVRTIGEALGIASTSTVHGHLRALERKGRIRRNGWHLEIVRGG